MRFSSLAAGVALVSVFACSTAPSDDSSTGAEQAQTGIEALTAVKAREWARCFLQSTSAGAALVCKSTKRDAADPLATSVEISATSLAPTFLSAKKLLDTENGGGAVVASFARNAFPIIVIAHARFPDDAIKTMGLRKADLQLSTTINSPEQLSETADRLRNAVGRYQVARVQRPVLAEEW